MRLWVDAGQVGRGGVYLSSGTAGRRRRSFLAAAFIAGEGAPVVAGGGDDVLQLGRNEGVRDLQEIARIGSSGRSSPGRADGGGARLEAA
jgi:hypothetical protein